MNEVSRAEFDEVKRRLEACEERLHRGDTTLALLDQRLQQIDDKLTELGVGLQALRENPVKRWDAITSQIVNWVVALLLGYVAIKIGLN